MVKFSRFILKLFNYKIDYSVPDKAKKCVLLFAPHTSMLDFVVGFFALKGMGLETAFLIKKEVFWFPLGSILKKLGGIPVDRKNALKFPHYVAEVIKSRKNIALLIAPEGTRKLNKKWKKGFYYIAKEANVPLFLGYLDYASKCGGIGHEYVLTDNPDEDISIIKNYYNGMRGRHKGCFDRENYPHAHPEWLSK